MYMYSQFIIQLTDLLVKTRVKKCLYLLEYIFTKEQNYMHIYRDPKLKFEKPDWLSKFYIHLFVLQLCPKLIYTINETLKCSKYLNEIVSH